MNQSVLTNYHSFLGEIGETFDNVLKTARNQNEREWKSLAWKGPLHQLKGLFRMVGPISKFFMVVLPLIAPGGITALLTLLPVPLWASISGGVLLFVLTAFLIYWLMVWFYGEKMASMGNPEFHVGAFKVKRPKEYKMWAPFFQKHNATFEGLYEFVTPLLTSGRDNIDSLVAFAQMQADSAHDSVEYRMKMLEGKSWIWNFHFDESNERVLKLALSNDIIEVREVYRLVHAFCLLLQKQEIEGREAHDHHGRDEASQKAN